MTWADRIGDIVAQALEAGTIEREKVKGVLIAPNGDFTGLAVFALKRWENYPSAPDAGSALGVLSIGAWLDELDARVPGAALPPPRARFRPRLGATDPAMARAYAAALGGFYAELEAQAIGAARGALATLVPGAGVFILQPEIEGYLVAFADRDGGPLIPLREHRKEQGYSSLYPFAVLTESGFNAFYPKSGGSKQYRFDEVEIYRRGDRNELTLKLRDDLHPVQFSSNHTQLLEEYGGPSQEESFAVFAAHVEKASARFPAPPAPSLEDPAAFSAWAQTFEPINPRVGAITRLAEERGLDEVWRIVERSELSEVKGRLTRSFGALYVGAGRWAEGLALLRRTPGDERPYSIHHEVEALHRLGRHDEAVAAARSKEAAKRADECAPFAALALDALGKTEEALALLGSSRATAETLAVRAKLLARSKPDEAVAALRQAFGKRDALVPLVAELAADPLFAPWFAERERRAKLRAAGKAAIASLSGAAPEVPVVSPAPVTATVRISAAVEQQKPPAPEGPEAPYFDEGVSRTASSGALLAVAYGAAIDVYRDGKLVAAFGLERIATVRELAFAGELLFATANEAGVLVIDTSREEPAVVRVLAGSADELSAADGWVVAREGKRLWFFSGGELRAEMPCDNDRFAIARAGDALIVAQRGSLMRFDVSSGVPRPVETAAFVDERGRSERVEPLSVSASGFASGFAAGAEVRVLESDGLRTGTIAPLSFAPAELRAAVDAASEEVAAWAAAQVAAAGETIGVVAAMWYGAHVRLRLSSPRSLPGAAMYDHAPISEAALEVSTLSRFAEAEDPWVSALLHDLTRAALVRVLSGLSLEGKASGRAYLLWQGDDTVLVAAPSLPGDFRPKRLVEAAPRKRTLREVLSSHDAWGEIDLHVERAQKDAGMRAELYALARESMSVAVQIAAKLARAGVEGAFEVVLEVGRDARFVDFFRGFVDRRPEARARLEEMAASDDAHAALSAMCALGCAGDPRAVELLRAHLESGEVSWDLLEEVGATMSDAGLRAVRAELEKVASRLNEHQVGEVGVTLFRAGVEAPPAELLRAASRARQGEQYAGELFGDDEPEASVTALRMWAAAAVSAALAQGGRVWPSAYEPEVHAASWRRFFEVAAPMLSERGQWELLHQALAARAKPGEEHAADRAMARNLVLFDLVRGDPLATALGDALRNAPPGTYGREELDEAMRAARLARIQYGWGLVKAGKYAEARKVADAAKADAPNDGQTLFFDARVAWLEKSSPEAATALIPGYLERVDGHDSVGRARLLNLHGAALDALGRPAESIPWFEKAAQVQPTESMYVANIAEALEKTGDLPRAVTMARKAASLGNTSPLVQRLAASAKEIPRSGV